MSLKLRSGEAEPKRHSGIFKSIVIAAAVLLSTYVVFSIVSANMKISSYQQQYDDLVAQTEAVQDENEKLSRYLSEDADLDEYIENMARDKLDYARPDERVYYIVPDSGN